MANRPEPPTVTSSAREIFLRVLETAEEGRRAALDSACGDDELVRTEVESLLEESGAMGDFLETPAVPVDREPPKVELPRQARAGSFGKGDQIGPFELKGLLGEGGCGMVYEAEQSSPVRRTVALKVIKLGMDTKSVIARFESERQALAMMDHPNIAKVLDAGATEAGRPYFVMELVRGVPITEFCDQQKLTTRERLELFIQACGAIQHAHQKGIIHRDIKPSNIMIADDHGAPSPKVIDFGIAKATEQRLTEHTLFTSTESFIGTPAYMSPEQAEVGGIDIDTRSDIYSLGVLLYELLVGKPPFDASELRKLSLDEIRRTVRETEPERPSARLDSLPDPERVRVADCHGSDAGRLSGVLRGDLDWIVMKCLEKDRSRRYATASDLISDLQRHLAAQPVLARPPSTLYRAKKLLHRHGGVILAGSLLVAVLLVAIVTTSMMALRATRAEQEAQEGRATQADLRERAEKGAREALLNEYVAEINLTQLALSEGNFGRAQQLIDRHQPAAGRPDNRGFEWRYLAAQCRGDDHVALPNLGSSVLCLAYSPDGRTLAVGLDGEIQLWNTFEGRRITSLPGTATSLLFLGDGHTLVSSDSESTWVVDTSTWLEVTELRGEGGPLALSADGSQLATTSREGVTIWDTTDWFELLLLPAALPGARAFSPDGRQLAAVGAAGISLFSLESGRLVRVLEDSASLIGGNSGDLIAFSEDGERVYAVRNTGSDRGVFVISFWDAESGDELGTLSNRVGHAGAITDLSIGGGGALLASASLDHSIGLWDLSGRKKFDHLHGHRGEVWSVAVSPDGRSVASGSKDGDLRLWPTSPTEARDVIEGARVPLRFSRDGKRLAALGADSQMTIYRLPGLEHAGRFELGKLGSISAGMDVIAHASDSGTVTVLDVDSGRRRPIEAAARALDFLLLNPDGTLLLTHAPLQPLLAWDLAQGDRQAFQLEAESALISADGKVLVGFGQADRVEIWDVAGRRKLREFTAPRSFGFSAAISSDGGRLALSGGLADSENQVELWDTKSGEALGSFSGHKQSVRSIAFSPDGRTLATASGDGTLKLWNVTTRQELLSIRRLGSSLRHLQFSPDGQWLVGGSHSQSDGDRPGGELRLFHAPHP